MQTYGNPRFIFSGEMRPDELILPRGVLEKAIEILDKAGASTVIQDERIKGKRLKVEFTGVLTPTQEEAVGKIKKHDDGILVAPPGVGKTVMGCAVIARRKISTLILVHRQQLLDQWRSQISVFLGVNPKEIGVFGGTKKKRTGKIDLAMIQTLTKAEDILEIAADYGQVIIDECHHVPATSFEALMKQFPAKFVLGLTATPYRKDGLEKILFQQCGPSRFEIKSIEGILAKKVTIRETGFRLPEDVGQKPPYHVIAHLITTDAKRNAMIVSDIIRAFVGISASLFLSRFDFSNEIICL
jgi:superfamily II DNA or RNA helicase